jgi:tetratricopeptide (TPR) repeat protein
VTGADPAAGEAVLDVVAPVEAAAGAAADAEAGVSSGADAAVRAEQDTAEAPRPWARGVSAARQEKARTIYAAANDLLHEYLLEEAMEKYREALRHWDHPAIHYNLARALDSLGRPLEADAHMQKALRYGAAAYSQLEYTQVLNFRRLLDQKLSGVVIVSVEPDITVALDGDPILAGRGAVEKRVLPGEHLLVIRGPGQSVNTRLLALQRGRQTRIELETRRRWKSWQPWSVLGAGALVGLAGGVSQWRAQANIERHQRLFAEACPQGCPDDTQPALARLRQHAIWQNRVGVTALITGSAVIIVGTSLVVLNQLPPFRIELNRAAPFSVQPMLAPDSAGVSVRLEF